MLNSNLRSLRSSQLRVFCGDAQLCRTVGTVAGKQCLWGSFQALCFATGNAVSRCLVFCFLLTAEEEVKEEERKCLHQRPASISPSVRGEAWSLPWLISRLIWQDMFDLIKAFGRKAGARRESRKTVAIFPLTRNSITQLHGELNSSFFCRFVTFTCFRASGNELTGVCITQDLAVNEP